MQIGYIFLYILPVATPKQKVKKCGILSCFFFDFTQLFMLNANLLLVFVLMVVVAQTPPPHVCLSNLKNEMTRIMSKLPRSHFGVLVKILHSDVVIFFLNHFFF